MIIMTRLVIAAMALAPAVWMQAQPATIAWDADLAVSGGDDYNVRNVRGFDLALDSLEEGAASLEALEVSGYLTLAPRLLPSPVTSVRARVEAAVPVNAAVAVEVRGLRDGQRWTEWYPAGGTLPEAARKVQVRITLTAVPGGAGPIVHAVHLTATPARSAARTGTTGDWPDTTTSPRPTKAVATSPKPPKSTTMPPKKGSTASPKPSKGCATSPKPQKSGTTSSKCTCPTPSASSKPRTTAPKAKTTAPVGKTSPSPKVKTPTGKSPTASPKVKPPAGSPSASVSPKVKSPTGSPKASPKASSSPKVKTPTGSPTPSVAPVSRLGLTYRVFATQEGNVGDLTANGHTIAPKDHFVALPSRRGLSSTHTGEYSVRVCVPKGGLCEYAPVWDVGPWNTKDDYWNEPTLRQTFANLPQGHPESQAAFQTRYNGGLDMFKRMVLNPAGIDLADGTFLSGLRLRDNAWVNVTYLWTGNGPTGAVLAHAEVYGLPSITAPVVGLAARYAHVPIKCRVTGTSVQGPLGRDTTWYRITRHHYVPAPYIRPAATRPAFPSC
ncbi:hypothetical protein ACIBG8_34555 [Nonomuraea sp. NPDC050556]|uniref:hypothetical protein n=1 Tax=Nonomuraea sp. NPDC050556 TaxID=3364369 RepID=UPI0037ABEA1A